MRSLSHSPSNRLSSDDEVPPERPRSSAVEELAGLVLFLLKVKIYGSIIAMWGLGLFFLILGLVRWWTGP